MIRINHSKTSEVEKTEQDIVLNLLEEKQYKQFKENQKGNWELFIDHIHRQYNARLKESYETKNPLDFRGFLVNQLHY